MHRGAGAALGVQPTKWTRFESSVTAAMTVGISTALTLSSAADLKAF